ncbi:hypothetical protein HK405_009064 [Cladochytrium tenue]|nr:hypothetical protein HK405_009064 [Cladochytrium tenue]
MDGADHKSSLIGGADDHGLPAGLAAWRAYEKRSGVRPGVESKMRKIFTQEDLTVAALIDDSSSMTHQVRRRGDGSDPIPFGTTRFAEVALHLEDLLRLTVACGHTRGIDVHFVNREGGIGLTSEQQIRRLFEVPPKGLTRVNELLRDVVMQYTNVELAPKTGGFLRFGFGQPKIAKSASSVTSPPIRRNVLLLLFMDSAPTDGGFPRLYDYIERLPTGIYLTQINCQDMAEDDTAIMLWEETLPRYHGQSFYAEELRVARAAKGPATVYTRAAYVQDMVLGPFYPGDAKTMRNLAGKIIEWRSFKKGGVIYGPDFGPSPPSNLNPWIGGTF